MRKDDVRWALHWPKEDVPDEFLDQYPDLQKVNMQIRQVTDTIILEDNTATIQGISFDIRDFPMSDRIAQREFVREVGITAQEIEDVKIGKKSWEVFHASEMVVIGIQKRLRTELDTNHNPYRVRDYGSLDEGDVVKYGNKEVTVAKHFGAHMMKYYRDGDDLKPIFPSRFVRVVSVYTPIEDEDKTDVEFTLNGYQLEFDFAV